MRLQRLLFIICSVFVTTLACAQNRSVPASVVPAPKSVLPPWIDNRLDSILLDPVIVVEPIYEDSLSKIINFEDSVVKRICVSHWDKDGDGELSVGEASEVTDLGDAFTGEKITSFEEFGYFTNVTHIDTHTFNATKLVAISLPRSIRKIESFAFWGCVNLRKVVSWIIEPFEVPAFEYHGIISYTGEYGREYGIVFTSATLYVPWLSVSKYKTTPSWSSFEKIVGMIMFEEDVLDKDNSKNTGMDSAVKDDSRRYNVYTLNGVLVRSLENVSYEEAIKGLSPGIYIVNGKKVVVK